MQRWVDTYLLTYLPTYVRGIQDKLYVAICTALDFSRALAEKNIAGVCQETASQYTFPRSEEQFKYVRTLKLKPVE